MEPTCYNEDIINIGDYMDEKNLSWRAQLAKSNINILSVDQNKWYIEFTYHPRPGTFKWCKTFFSFSPDVNVPDGANARLLLDKVLALRKELEG